MTPPVLLLQAAQEVVVKSPGPVAMPHESETPESIEFRATSMTLILEKIMACGSGYSHGGLND
jgi:hypothetical protein